MDIVAAVCTLLGGVSELAETTVRPVTLIEEAGGPAGNSLQPDRLRRQDLMISVWADTKPQAHDLVWAHRSALLAWPRNQPNSLTVTYCSVTAPSWVPDETWPTTDGRPSPRYVLTATITAH